MNKVLIASDHAGFEYKQIIKELVTKLGYQLFDAGPAAYDPEDDYPDFAIKLADDFQRDNFKKAIIVCGSGVGVSVAINKYKGIRAGICHDTYSAHQGVEHDNMNVLCMGSRIVGIEPAKEIVIKFLSAEFSGEARHVRRLNKIVEIENRNFK